MALQGPTGMRLINLYREDIIDTLDPEVLADGLCLTAEILVVDGGVSLLLVERADGILRVRRLDLCGFGRLRNYRFSVPLP
eukprot:2510463-Prorocentrum_lima.AAC.1